MSTDINGLCQIALENWKNKTKWRNLWTSLLFIFGAAVVLFLCASILLFIRESWLPGAITTVGTICSGTAIAWVVSRRNEAAKEDDAAFSIVRQECSKSKSVGAGGTNKLDDEILTILKQEHRESTTVKTERTPKLEDELAPKAINLIKEFQKKQLFHKRFK